MCGIAGYADIGMRATPDPAILARMAATLAHRGPDSSGSFVADHVGIGVRRLSICDPRTGDQPITNHDGTVVMCCNGEIFNHEDLRGELLAAGHTFATASDVEVLVHLYEELGPSLVHKLNGQFSFVIYDRTRRRLLLARDPVGITPLHYTVVNGTLCFASEIKALLAHPQVPREVDLTGLDQVLMLPGLVSPRTMFAGIASLPPGHLLELAGGTLRVRQYWDLDYPCDDAAPGQPVPPWREYAERLEGALLQAVGLRMRADVPHAYYLSGGLDSSLVAAMAASLAAGQLSTLSVVFPDDRISERPFQRLMAQTLRSAHTEIHLTPADLLTGLPEVVKHCECPLKESYNVASLRLSRAVRAQGAKVALTGEGADELFAGYVGYKYDELRSARGRPPRPEAADEQRQRARLWGNPQLAYIRDLSAAARTRRWLYSPALAAHLDSFDCLAQPLVDHSKLAGRHILHQRSYLDFKLRLADHLLGDHGDRVALANSVETRYPFLDPAVINCARDLPPALALHDFEEKYLVKRIAEDYLPAEIVAREKFAFQASASPDLVCLGETWLESYLSPRRIRREGYFNPDAVRQLRDRYASKEFSLDLIVDDDLLMIVLTYGLFLEIFGLPHLS